jgi:hypothetical protein
VFTGVIRKQRIEEVDSRELKAESENREIEGKARVVFCAWFSTRAEYHVRWSKVRSNDRDTDVNCRCSVIYSLEKKILEERFERAVVEIWLWRRNEQKRRHDAGATSNGGRVRDKRTDGSVCASGCGLVEQRARTPRLHRLSALTSSQPQCNHLQLFDPHFSRQSR